MSSPVSQAELLALLAGSLEPDRALAVREALAASQTLRARHGVLEQRWLALQAAMPAAVPSWRIPPVGWGQGANRIDPSAPYTAVAGSQIVRPGDRFFVDLSAGPAPEDHGLVVLHREPAGWTVVFPTQPEAVLRMSELPALADGRVQLPLVARGPAGLHRWAVCVVPLPLPVDWSAGEPARWDGLRAAIGRGEVRVEAFEQTVG